jgi:hypothetical protein
VPICRWHVGTPAGSTLSGFAQKQRTPREMDGDARVRLTIGARPGCLFRYERLERYRFELDNVDLVWER